MLPTSSTSSSTSSGFAGYSFCRSSRSPSPTSISSLTTVSRSPSISLISSDEDTRSPVRSRFPSTSSSSSSSHPKTPRRSSTSISSGSSSNSRCGNSAHGRQRLSRNRNRLTSGARRKQQSMEETRALRESLDEGESPARRENQSLPLEEQAPEQKDFKLRLKAKMKDLLKKASAQASQDHSQKLLPAVIEDKKKLSFRYESDENVASGSRHEVKHTSQCSSTSKAEADIQHKLVSHLPIEQAAPEKISSIDLSSTSSSLSLSSLDANEETTQPPTPTIDAGPSNRRPRVQCPRKRIMKKLRKHKQPESGSLYPFIMRSYRMLEPVEEDVPSSEAIFNDEPMESHKNPSVVARNKEKETKDPNGKKEKSSGLIVLASNQSQKNTPVNLRDELSKLETPATNSRGKPNSSLVRKEKSAPLGKVSAISAKSVKRNMGLAKRGHQTMTSLIDVPAPRQSRDDFPKNSRDSDRNYETPSKERKQLLKDSDYGVPKTAPILSPEEPISSINENCRHYLQDQNKNKDILMCRVPTQTAVDLPKNSRSKSLSSEDELPLDYFVTLLTQKIEDLRETLQTIRKRMFQESQVEANSPPYKKRMLATSKLNKQELQHSLNTDSSSNQGDTSPIQTPEKLPEKSKSKSPIKHEKSFKEHLPLFKQKTTLPAKAVLTSIEKKDFVCALEERRESMLYEDTSKMSSSCLEDSTSVQSVEKISMSTNKLLDKRTKMSYKNLKSDPNKQAGLLEEAVRAPSEEKNISSITENASEKSLPTPYRSKTGSSIPDTPIKGRKSKHHEPTVLFKPSERKQASNLKTFMKDSIMEFIPLGKRIPDEMINTREPLALTPSRKGRNISAQGRSVSSSSSIPRSTPSPESPPVPEPGVKSLGKKEGPGQCSSDRPSAREQFRSRWNQRGGSRSKSSSEDVQEGLPSATERDSDDESRLTEVAERCEFLEFCPLHGCSSHRANRSPRE